MSGAGPMGVKIAAVVAIPSCRAQARHPRLAVSKPRKGVDGGPSPTMTVWERPCHLSRYFNANAACAGHDDTATFAAVSAEPAPWTEAGLFRRHASLVPRQGRGR